MGYVVNKMYVRKDGTVAFRLIWESYKGKEREEYRHIKKKEWRSHGFSNDLSYEEAKQLARSKNQDKKAVRWEAKRQRIQQRLDKEDSVKSRFFPEPHVIGFEKSILNRFCDGDRDSRKFKKFLGFWRAARRLINSVQIHPVDYCDEPEGIYNYCSRNKFSPEYVKKLRRILNLWGMFLSKKESKPFLPLPPPSKNLLSKIEGSFFAKNQEGCASRPLLPLVLTSARSKFKHVENYNWLFISLWFGLRPQEVDGLHSSDRFAISSAITGEGTKVDVLKVYQAKLTSLSPDKRWKTIPIIFDEQREAIGLIRSGKFRRPLNKTITSAIGPGITTYGGRKHFTDLMLDKGYSLESVSAWLGHTSIEMTWRKYKNRTALTLKKAG